MKSALALLLASLVALPAIAASDREVKQELIGEVLALMDIRKLTETYLDLALRSDGEETEEMRVVRSRVRARLDYKLIAEELYAPLLAERFSADELRDLAAFYRTKAGQKSVQMLPDLASVILVHSQNYVFDEVRRAQQELEKERDAGHPEIVTMKDLRVIAVCLEARATDTNEYPKVSFDELPPLLEPVYVKVLPRVDGWGTPYAYVSDGVRYRIVSAGADKTFDWSSRQLEPENTTTREMDDLKADLIFQDGSFIQVPRGTMKGQ